MNGLDTSPVPTSSTPAKGTKPLTVCWSSPRLLSLCSGKRDLRVSQGAVQLISSVFLFSFSLYKVNQFFPLTPCCRVISSTKRNGREPGHAGNHLLLSVPWGEAFLLELKNLSKFILAQSSCQVLLFPTPFPPIRRECSRGAPEMPVSAIPGCWCCQGPGITLGESTALNFVLCTLIQREFLTQKAKKVRSYAIIVCRC